MVVADNLKEKKKAALSEKKNHITYNSLISANHNGLTEFDPQNHLLTTAAPGVLHMDATIPF